MLFSLNRSDWGIGNCTLSINNIIDYHRWWWSYWRQRVWTIVHQRANMFYCIYCPKMKNIFSLFQMSLFVNGKTKNNRKYLILLPLTMMLSVGLSQLRRRFFFFLLSINWYIIIFKDSHRVDAFDETMTLSSTHLNANHTFKKHLTIHKDIA